MCGNSIVERLTVNDRVCSSHQIWHEALVTIAKPNVV